MLSTPIAGSDYINASHITGAKSCTSKFGLTIGARSSETVANAARFSNINFIASQGPLPDTCVHHLQMISENKIDIIIMLTKLKETSNKGKDKQ